MDAFAEDFHDLYLKYINLVNFNQAMMVTHNGIFFDNVIEELSYFFTQNQKTKL